MWFKNARLYTVDLSELGDAIRDEIQFEDALSACPFKPVSGNDISSIGFAPLFGNNTTFSFKTGGGYFCRLIEETKLLPASVIRTELDNLILQKEAELQRELRKNEKEALKTAITGKLLSQAFATRRDILAYVQPDKKFLVVSASSAKRAEKVVAMLREAFVSFPAKVLQPRCAVEDRLTSWISKGEIPQGFSLGTDVVLKSTDDEGGVVRVSREDLSSEEIMVHIEAGKVVNELQLLYTDALSLVLTSDLALKRVKPTDLYLEKNLPEKADDQVANLQSHLVLQGALLDEIVERILEIFDCEH